MNSQNNDDDSMNFSMIDKRPEDKPCYDFSVQSILEEQQPPDAKPHAEPLSLQRSVEQVFSKIRSMQLAGRSVVHGEKSRVGEGGTFLKDLERMEKELSFQSESYNIYEENNPNCSTEIIQNNKSKTLSYLKTTKESNKSASKSINQDQYVSFNDYFGPLIIEFKKDHKIDHHAHQGKNQSKREHNLKVKKSKNDSKNNSQLSSDYSGGCNTNTVRKASKSRSKDELNAMLRVRQKSKSSKNIVVPHDFKKSKSRSNHSKINAVSKSHSNLKTSCEADNYASKVFTQYYGTDINFNNKRPELKQKKQTLLQMKSRQKTSRSKSKLGLLSPRGKPSRPIGRK